ncbi:hypothetical protein H0264_37600 [Nocardia huaxiensis]|uniref:Uncharacterized protein n=1 Tax=Nocardia huaxiensis TaxID=2755382 RepID=A0A7D6ZPU1_9NOCA|nr:hypothetical protein [Nocardia huaxiensis]QLY30745.1 hypothetical protein H0264_37600 [Nocardia huaxiensis]
MKGDDEWFEQETPERKAAWVRQETLMATGLIAIGVVVIQPFLTAGPLNWSATIAVIAFAVALPHLAIVALIDDWPSAGYPTSSLLPSIAKSIGLGSGCVGVAAAFWHISWVAGVVLLASGFGAFIAHTVFFDKVSMEARPETGGEPTND